MTQKRIDLPSGDVPGAAASESGGSWDEGEVRPRAYEISLRPDAGTPEENWIRAVDELRAEREAEAAALRPEPEPESPFPPNTSSLTHP